MPPKIQLFFCGNISHLTWLSEAPKKINLLIRASSKSAAPVFFLFFIISVLRFAFAELKITQIPSLVHRDMSTKCEFCILYYTVCIGDWHMDIVDTAAPSSGKRTCSVGLNGCMCVAKIAMEAKT